MLAAGFEFRRSGACELGLAQVAEGVIDGYAAIFTKPWDAVAGCVLVREAGGRTNRFEHDVIARIGNPVVAAGAGLHDELRSATAFAESGDAL